MFRKDYGFYWAPDKGGAEGGTDGTDKDTDDGAGDEDPNAGNDGTDQIAFSSEQQAHIDKLIEERLSRAKGKWEADAEAAKKKADEEAEKARLKEQAEWQKLAEKHEGRVQELEPQVQTLTDQVTAYKTAIEGILESRLKELGDKAKTAVEALPGEPDALAQLSWLNANAELFGGTEGGRHIGTPPKGKRPPKGDTKEPRLSTRSMAQL